LSKLELQKPFCFAVEHSLRHLQSEEGKAIIVKSFRVYDKSWFPDVQATAKALHAEGKLFATTPSTKAQSAFAIAAQLPEIP
jgi:hypothetical protein